jgi:drug/metabolite transporter (DMT)-like permease
VSATVVVVIAISCVLHASWNLLGRSDPKATLAFFGRMNLVGVAAGAAPAVAALAVYGSMPVRAWLLCAVSGTFLGVYFFVLGKGYQVADLSTVYPVARALPVLMLAVVDLFRGRAPTLPALAGMALVIAGCLLAPLVSLKDVHWRRWINGATWWVVLTALCTTGYTLCDKLAQEDGAAAGASLVFVLVYGYFFFVFGTVVLWLLLLATGEGIGARGDGEQLGWLRPGLASIGNIGAYVLILWVYREVDEASYVVAFRQFSIVIGVGLALWLFREPGARVRIPAALLITAGLVLVGALG